MEIDKIKIGICIPTIREDCLKKFLELWQPQFDLENVCFYITEDSERKQINYKHLFREYEKAHHKEYSHKEIAEDLGRNSWIICKKNSSHREYGYYKAWQDNCDMIVTLDDDCYPIEDIKFLEGHWNKLNMNINMWGSTSYDCFGKSIPVRGMPYKNTEIKNKVIINHGLWKNNLDLDAPHQLCSGDTKIDITEVPTVFGKYKSLCGMNLAFKREVTPLMYFGLQGEGWEFDRFDDIWCGIIAEKIATHLGKHITNGTPMIWHSKASNPFKNLVKEAKGIEVNEIFWQAIENIQLSGTDWINCYKEVALAIPNKISCYPEYFLKLSRAMMIWAGLFQNNTHKTLSDA